MIILFHKNQLHSSQNDSKFTVLFFYFPKMTAFNREERHITMPWFTFYFVFLLNLYQKLFLALSHFRHPLLMPGTPTGYVPISDVWIPSSSFFLFP